MDTAEFRAEVGKLQQMLKAQKRAGEAFAAGEGTEGPRELNEAINKRIGELKAQNPNNTQLSLLERISQTSEKIGEIIMQKMARRHLSGSVRKTTKRHRRGPRR